MASRTRKNRSGYYWRHVVCNGCSQRCRYRDFRAFEGDAFRQMYEMLWKNSDDPEQWVYKSRGVILGKLHEWKLKEWEDKIRRCPQNGAEDAEEDG